MRVKDAITQLEKLNPEDNLLVGLWTLEHGEFRTFVIDKIVGYDEGVSTIDLRGEFDLHSAPDVPAEA